QDIDLAALGPRILVNIVAEHPERGPNALSPRNLHPCLKPTVGLLEFAFRLQTGRRVFASDAVRTGGGLLAGFDNEAAVSVVEGIDVSVGVALRFVVARAPAAKVVAPKIRTRGRSGGRFELVGEGKGPDRGKGRHGDGWAESESTRPM